MKVLVTGFRGYVGSAVAHTLASRGDTVVALARSSEDLEVARGRGYAAVTGTLTDTSALSRLVGTVDGVFHGAASAAPSFADVNALAVNTMLEALTSTQVFAMQGGTGVFGDTGNRVFDGSEVPNAPPPLAQTSLLERSVIARGAAGPRTYVVYGSLVYGGEGAMIPNALVAAARLAGAGQMSGDGENRWSTVFIDDWANLIVSLIKAGPKGGAAFVAAARELSMRDVAAAVATAIGAAGKTIHLSADEAQLAWGFFAPLLAMNQRFSSHRAEQAVGFRPSGPPIEDELGRLAANLSSRSADAGL